MENLRELRKKNKVTQEELATFFNTSRQNISNWENGNSQADYETLKKLAEYFNVSIDYLLGGEPKKRGIKIPVLGTIPAGIPVEAITDIIDYEEITEEMAKKGDYFALQVKGDSMSPNIQNGDVVICLKQNNLENRQIGVVIVNGYNATLKRVMKHTNGISLIPDNENYETVFYDNEQIEELPIKILGVVVEIRRTVL